MLLKPILAVLALVSGAVVYGALPALLAPPEGGERLQPFDSDNYHGLGTFVTAVEGLPPEHAYKVQTLVGSPSVLKGIEHPEKVVYFAPGVSRPYRAEEIATLVDFTKTGGKTVIADDFGFANSLAQKFGIFYFGTDLWDLEEGRYDRNISLPLVSFTFAGKPYEVELNEPTGITLIQNPEVNTTVVAHCSEKCYADIDRSATVNIGDKKGNITVIMRAQLQDNITVNGVSTYVPTLGEAYFISDASIFTKEMMEKPSDLAKGVGGNQDFAKALISTLLPEGGTVIIDESRHLHQPGTQVVYSSFETGAVATSRADMAGVLIAGAGLMLAIIVVRAKDRESWIHKFDLSTFHPRPQLPETAAVQVGRLRDVARLKIQMTHSMSVEEFAAIPPEQMKAMIRDPMLIDLIMNPGRAWAPEELRPAAEHIRAWGK